MLVLSCLLFTPIYTEIENWDFEFCSRLDFQFFTIDERNNSVHWGINPTLKNTTPSFLPSHPLNLQTVQAPFLGTPPPYISVFREPPPKTQIFPWTPKISKFSSFTPYYILKVTKFLVRISQFEFLVMTEQSILVYELSLLLNIPDVSLFFVKKLHPPWSHSPLS